MKPQVTSVDVARLAAVSQSAVSRTFTPGASVSDDTRRKVLDAARLLGYRPNAHARSLITKRSRIIGLVLSQLGNLFYPAALQQLWIDPQTCGPLLAALPADRADDALAAVRAAGFQRAALIGRVLNPAPASPP